MSKRAELLLTNADLAGLPDDGKRYELIEGDLYVSTAPNLIHQRTLARIHILIASYLAQNPIGEILIGPGVIFSDYDGVIPDLVYLSKERSDTIATGERIYGTPTLVIEIVSPGTQNRDRDARLKLKLYAKFGVEEYWIVDPRQRTVDVYRQDAGILKLFTTFLSDESMTTPLLPGFTPSVRGFF